MWADTCVGLHLKPSFFTDLFKITIQPQGLINLVGVKLNKFVYRGADKSLARPEGKKIQRQKILIFIYPIYNHNWRNISTIYIYIYICVYVYKKLASNEIFSPLNKIHREVGRVKDLSAPLYNFRNIVDHLRGNRKGAVYGKTISISVFRNKFIAS